MRKIPKFNNENEEREFWSTHDFTNYIDWSKARKVQFEQSEQLTSLGDKIRDSLNLQESDVDKAIESVRSKPYEIKSVKESLNEFKEYWKKLENGEHVEKKEAVYFTSEEAYRNYQKNKQNKDK